MDKWMELTTNAYIADFYDVRDRLVAVIVQNGVAVMIRCVIEGHYLMKDDFFKAGTDYYFVSCAKVEQGMIRFTTDAEQLFEVDVLEEITKQTLSTVC